MPMLVDRVRYLHQPGAILRQLKHLSSAKELDAIWRRITQRPEQPGTHQNWNVMRLAIQHPAHLLGSESSRQLTMQAQESVLLFAHDETLGRHRGLHRNRRPL